MCCEAWQEETKNIYTSRFKQQFHALLVKELEPQLIYSYKCSLYQQRLYCIVLYY